MKLLIVLVLGFLVACSNQQAYEGIQASNRFECQKMPTQSQYDDCMVEANKSYQDYQSENQQ